MREADLNFRNKRLFPALIYGDVVQLQIDAAERSAAAKAEHPDAEVSIQLERAREEERAALARELHDEIGGALAAMRFVLSRARKNTEGTPGPVVAELDEMQSLVESATRGVHNAVHALRPGILEEGLVAALEWEAREFQRRTRISCHFQSNREWLDVPNDQRLAAYRVCQEALTNIAKHAGATAVEVHIHRDDDGLTLEITDNGKGFSPEDKRDQQTAEQSYGLIGMRERAVRHAGWLEVNSEVGKGTTIMLSLPLRRARDQRL